MSNYYSPGRFSILPPVVKNLIIINALFFLATVSLSYAPGIDLIDRLGLHFIGSQKFEPYQLLTYMFMHGNFGHLFFNMFAVWMFGSSLENVWGGKRFLIYYLITGFGAAAIHYLIVYLEMQPLLNAIQDYISAPSEDKLQQILLSKDFKIANFEMQQKLNGFVREYNLLSETHLKAAESKAIEYLLDYRNDFYNIPNIVGASGALFGILLAFGMMFPDTLIFIYFFIPIKAKYFVILYGLIELFSGIQNDPADNVAHYAHLGGMIFGYFIIRYWKKRGELF